jgi:diguanylate cyclase (GGDEF)-like protein
MHDHDETIPEIRAAPIQAGAPQKPCLTVLYGGPVGLVYTLPPGTEILIGRGADADIPLIEERRVSRKHAIIRVSVEGNVVIEDQGSSNGTFVNGTRVTRQELKDGDRIQIGYSCIIKFSYQDDLEYQLQHEIAGGIKDPVTRLHTKKYFHDRIDAEFSYARRRDEHLGVIIFAVDHFSKISLSHGHAAGELVIKEVARIINEILRAGDVFSRYDGERFALLARNLDDEGSVILAQRIRKIVRDHDVDFEGTRIQLSVSIGIATLADKPKKAEELIQIAEQSLQKTIDEAGENGIGGAAVATYLDNNDAAPTIHIGQNGEA